MLPLISVREHEPIYIGDSFNKQDRIISKRQAAEIEKISNFNGENIFKWGRNKIIPQQWVGLITISNLQIEILPKIDDIDSENDLRKNLLYMLSIANDIPYRVNNLGGVSTNNSTLLESYIKVFIDKLFELVKRGLIKQYVDHESNEEFLKGKFLIAQQIRHNLFNKAKFYVQYDEFSQNNIINTIIKATIIKLIKVTSSYDNKKRLNLLKNYFINVDERLFKVEDFDKVTITRMYSSYKGIIEICKVFWEGNLPDFYAGDTNTFNLLFDMNKIFEVFVRKILQLHSHEVLLPNLEFNLKKSSKYLLHDNNHNSYFKLIPDIVISDTKTGEVKIIIDTKWKKLNYSKKNLGISQGDMYQMYAYAREFSCPNIILLYPKLDKGKKIAPQFSNTTIKDRDMKITVHTIDLSHRLPEGIEKVKDQVKEIIELNI